jgi:hypothetical protein
MVELVQKAESDIHKRRLELSKDGTDEERTAVANAMSGLRVLRDVAVFLEKKESA